MKMEASNISLTSRRLNVRRYSGIVVSVLQGVTRRLSKPSAKGQQKAARAARLEKERHEAQSITQVQSLRFLR